MSLNTMSLKTTQWDFQLGEVAWGCRSRLCAINYGTAAEYVLCAGCVDRDPGRFHAPEFAEVQAMPPAHAFPSSSPLTPADNSSR